MQATVLLAQLTRLENQSNKREKNVLYLTDLIKGIEGIKCFDQPPEVNRGAYYEFSFLYDPKYFGGIDKGDFFNKLKNGFLRIIYG
jgi:dTDP-4-amino-4,6-dideoxygalactose transaminase